MQTTCVKFFTEFYVILCAQKSLISQIYT